MVLREEEEEIISWRLTFYIFPEGLRRLVETPAYSGRSEGSAARVAWCQEAHPLKPASAPSSTNKYDLLGNKEEEEEAVVEAIWYTGIPMLSNNKIPSASKVSQFGKYVRYDNFSRL